MRPWFNNRMLEVYTCAWIDLNIQILLYMKFVFPAEILKANDDLLYLSGQFNQNLVKGHNLCCFV